MSVVCHMVAHVRDSLTTRQSPNSNLSSNKSAQVARLSTGFKADETVPVSQFFAQTEFVDSSASPHQ